MGHLRQREIKLLTTSRLIIAIAISVIAAIWAIYSGFQLNDYFQTFYSDPNARRLGFSGIGLFVFASVKIIAADKIYKHAEEGLGISFLTDAALAFIYAVFIFPDAAEFFYIVIIGLVLCAISMIILGFLWLESRHILR
ncbi:hypothetical protein E4H12_08335 [Candidatus Thorarchaeota archaeon]|nr:MAG: hypothetical protein E4H12_08335 [Candidatus Thorarchaeota archaeon]